MSKIRTKYKVAITQNRIIKGGRLVVIKHCINVLNELGIIPDIITQKMRPSFDDLNKYYGKYAQYNVKKIFFDLRLPYEIHIVFFNFLCRFYCRNYDLIINSNNTSLWGPTKQTMLSYVHYPRKDRNISRLKSIHFPEGPNKRIYHIKEFFDILVRVPYRLNRKIPDTETIIANSKFTKNIFLKNYPGYDEDIEVIYPPVFDEKTVHPDVIKKHNDLIISLGRFTWEKRQLEQIKIAERLPKYNFAIIGFVKQGDGYYQQCLDYINKNKVKNVTLLENCPINQINEWFERARYFLHSTRNEPFGITTVQALTWNCLPVVHDSGGQIEIVFKSVLRYKNTLEAVNIFKEISAWQDSKRMELINELKKNLVHYSDVTFERKFKDLLITKYFHEIN